MNGISWLPSLQKNFNLAINFIPPARTCSIDQLCKFFFGTCEIRILPLPTRDMPRFSEPKIPSLVYAGNPNPCVRNPMSETESVIHRHRYNCCNEYLVQGRVGIGVGRELNLKGWGLGQSRRDAVEAKVDGFLLKCIDGVVQLKVTQM